MSDANNPGIDQDLLDTLTPEEREAMGADDLTSEDRAALAAVAGDTPPANTSTEHEDDEDEDEDDDDGEGEGAGEGAGTQAAEGTTQAPETATATTAADAGKDDAPVLYRAELAPDYQQRVDAVAAREAEVQAKFNDGEIDLAERDAELKKISADRDALLLERARVESLAEANKQTLEQAWHKQVSSFMNEAAKPELGGIDYRKDPAKAADLDEHVKMLARKPENADKDGAWFLNKAHRLVLAMHDIPLPTAKTTTDPKARIQQALEQRKPPLDRVQPNLSAVPGSDGPGDVDNEFAHINALDGLELEDAIRAMTPAQHAKWLRSQG